jgi:outer membrane protein assembly factor BamB
MPSTTLSRRELLASAATAGAAATGDGEWTGAGETYYGGPTVGELGVYAVGADGEVASWTREGAERWRTRIDPPVSGSPVPADGMVYVGTGDGLLYGLEDAE